MKKYRYNIRMFLLAGVLAISSGLYAQEATKEYHKEFVANPNTILQIDSRYGDVAIESWNNDQIVIDVIIKVEMSNKERAERVLNSINIIISEEGNTVKARTEFSRNFNINDFGRNANYTINYNVKMPLKTTLNLFNSYGNTHIINELAGLVNLNIRYGNLNVDKLSRGNEKPWNNITLSYGKGYVSNADWMSLNLRYSKIEISESTALLVESGYSDLTLGKTSSVVCEARYGSVKVQTINNLDVTNGYAGFKIGTLTTSLKYNGRYGPLSIDNIPAGFESINIDVNYSNVNLGIADNANYVLDSKASYGGIKLNEDNFKTQRRIIENSRTELSGIVGKSENPAAKVNINARYTNVRLNK